MTLTQDDLDAIRLIVQEELAPVSAQISAIGSGTGAALNYPVVEDNASAPIKGVSAVGTQTGTYANTLANDGTTHQIASVANAIDWVYGFNVGAARAASKLDIRANMDAVNDTVTVAAYNFLTTAWDTRTTIAGTTETLYDIPLLAAHTGTGADEGRVYIRFTFAEGDAGTLVIDEAYVQAQQSGSLAGYALGAIWVNTAASNTNTVPYVDGTADNPVSTWAAALTLSTVLGIKRFKIAASSSITLTGDSTGFEMLGDGLWSLALGGQDISSAFILKASISGLSSGSNAIIEDGLINPGTSTGPAYFVRCGFNTTSGSPFTAAAIGQYAFVDCVSMVPGSGTPYFNFAGTGGVTGINFRRWSGGSNVTLDSNCTMTMEVVTGGGQTFVTGGGNVEVRGICRAVTLTSIAGSTTQIAVVTGPVTVNGTGGTVNIYGVTAGMADNSAGAVTINNYAVSRATINAEADTALADYDLPTLADLNGLETHGDATWATADVSALALEATVEALNDPTPAAIADAVWDEALSGHTTSGTAGAALAASGAASDPWSVDLPGDYESPEAGYIIGRLAGIDTSAVSVTSNSVAGHLTLVCARTFEASVTGLTIPADWESAIWTLKWNRDQADTASILQLRVSNPADAVNDGLLRLNGVALVAPITLADGSLTVDQAGGAVAIWLSDELTAQLRQAVGLGWDVKFIDADGDSSGTRGTADVTLTETRTLA